MHTGAEQPRFTAAAIQAGPVFRDAPDYFDGDATLAKAVNLIHEAGRNGARLIVFPECWLPCFPYWSLDLTQDRTAFADLWAKLLWGSVEVPGPITETLGAAARDAGAYLVMGINEKDARFRGRMYNSILYIDPQGKVMGTHRKICNTVQERFFHCPGDGAENLETVFPTDIGHLGGSMCGEHSQLTLSYHWIMKGIQVHCSLWPGHCRLKSTTDLLSRSFCFNAGTFGVVAATFIPEVDQPREFFQNSLFSVPQAFAGGSGIVSPLGEYLAGPVYDREDIIYGEIDLSDVDRSRCAVNLTGLYSRWDLLRLSVQRNSYEPVTDLATDPYGFPATEKTASIEARLEELEQQVARLITQNRPEPSSPELPESSSSTEPETAPGAHTRH